MHRAPPLLILTLTNTHGYASPTRPKHEVGRSSSKLRLYFWAVGVLLMWRFGCRPNFYKFQKIKTKFMQQVSSECWQKFSSKIDCSVSKLILFAKSTQKPFEWDQSLRKSCSKHLELIFAHVIITIGCSESCPASSVACTGDDDSLAWVTCCS